MVVFISSNSNDTSLGQKPVATKISASARRTVIFAVIKMGYHATRFINDLLASATDLFSYFAPVLVIKIV
jgi:hypothetical protein